MQGLWFAPIAAVAVLRSPHTFWTRPAGCRFQTAPPLPSAEISAFSACRFRPSRSVPAQERRPQHHLVEVEPGVQERRTEHRTGPLAKPPEHQRGEEELLGYCHDQQLGNDPQAESIWQSRMESQFANVRREMSSPGRRQPGKRLGVRDIGDEVERGNNQKYKQRQLQIEPPVSECHAVLGVIEGPKARRPGLLAAGALASAAGKKQRQVQKRDGRNQLGIAGRDQERGDDRREADSPERERLAKGRLRQTHRADWRNDLSLATNSVAGRVFNTSPFRAQPLRAVPAANRRLSRSSRL